jgi:hypothetical protein
MIGGLASVFQLGTAAADEAPWLALYREGRYLPLLRWSRETEGDDLMQQVACMVGDEATALATARPSAKTLLPLGRRARARDALTRIVEAAVGYRIVMINEAHVAARHRWFLGKLLIALRASGFTHLAAETFSNFQRGGPLRSYAARKPLHADLGPFVADPQFAEAVRQAAEVGFQFVAYEQRSDQDVPAGEEQDAQMSRREAAQTDNLARAISDAGPTARFVVYVGYDHVTKRPDHAGRRWLAARLKDLTGFAPLTVNQSLLGSFGPRAPDHAAVAAALARFRPTRPVVVEDDDGAFGAERARTDLTIMHPRLADKWDRPGWLASDPARRALRIPLPTLNPADLCLLQAVPSEEDEHSIPSDQILVAPGAREAVLFLRPGLYQIRLECNAGHTALAQQAVS